MNMKAIISGDKVYLRAAEEADLELLYVLMNDRDTNGFANMSIYPTSRQDARSFLKSSDRRVFTVCLNMNSDKEKPLGFVILHSEITEYRAIEIGILLSKDFWNRGFGFEAIHIATQFLFCDANFVRISAYIAADNCRSVGLFEKAGFVKEGTLRSFMYWQGEYRNAYVYAKVRD